MYWEQTVSTPNQGWQTQNQGCAGILDAAGPAISRDATAKPQQKLQQRQASSKDIII